MDADQAAAGTGGDHTSDIIETTIAPPIVPVKPVKARAPKKAKSRAARKPAATTVAVLADAGTTRPRPRDESGRALDEHGLPLNGPARVRALDALGKPDPNTHPDQWPAQGEVQE
ncbi:hypothetical protein [Sphingomonas sp. SRS2]|uniref:hypothetical protein n=1 Tax=Sphingomonas sp. SRS2 TaxID=133190 RepID=UPI0006184DEB|nr:hypothetical protein [Sphingomonas sp. SRS2]KKC27441.1 hypothetical protein WP12_03435 [Sphingomonas sp. SRS2]